MNTVTRQWMDVQADRIERTCEQHGVRARVWGGDVLPRVIRYQMSVGGGTKLERVQRLAEELAMALAAPNVRVYRAAAAVMVEVPRPGEPSRVTLDGLLRRMGREPGPMTAVLGLDQEGQTLLVRLPSPNACHVLVVGMTGSGKTVLGRTLLGSLAMFNRPEALRLVLIDVKRGRAYGDLAHLPHVLGRLVTTAEEAPLALGWLVEEMERRDGEGINSPRLVCAIDELADLMMVGGREVEQALVRLAQRGREAGIHLVCGTQRPSASVMNGLLRANFPVRLVGVVGTPEDAKVATGIAGSGAEKLLGGGDFLCVARGEVIRFQAAVMDHGKVTEQ